MRAAILAIAVTLIAVLAAGLYHLRTVDSWADRLRAEQAAHVKTRAERDACQSAIRAACAVATAQDGKADAARVLQSLIDERKKK